MQLVYSQDNLAVDNQSHTLSVSVLLSQPQSKNGESTLEFFLHIMAMGYS